MGVTTGRPRKALRPARCIYRIEVNNSSQPDSLVDLFSENLFE
jgi:hypothetical protein